MSMRKLIRCGMLLFEWTLVLLLAAVLLAALARRLEVPYPALLALAGAVLAFLPIAPEIEIDPDLALALFVAPVLLDAAFDTSPRDLKRNGLAPVFPRALARVHDAAPATIPQLVGPVGVGILAARPGLSAHNPMVGYAIPLPRPLPRTASPRNRVSSYSVWETAVFVLNVLA